MLGRVDLMLDPVPFDKHTYTHTHVAMPWTERSPAYCSEVERLQLAGAGSALTLSPISLPPPSYSLAVLSQLIEPPPPPTAADRPCHCCSAKVRAWQLKLPTGGVDGAVVERGGVRGQEQGCTNLSSWQPTRLAVGCEGLRDTCVYTDGEQCYRMQADDPNSRGKQGRKKYTFWLLAVWTLVFKKTKPYTKAVKDPLWSSFDLF